MSNSRGRIPNGKRGIFVTFYRGHARLKVWWLSRLTVTLQLHSLCWAKRPFCWVVSPLSFLFFFCFNLFSILAIFSFCVKKLRSHVPLFMRPSWYKRKLRKIRCAIWLAACWLGLTSCMFLFCFIYCSTATRWRSFRSRRKLLFLWVNTNVDKKLLCQTLVHVDKEITRSLGICSFFFYIVVELSGNYRSYTGYY